MLTQPPVISSSQYRVQTIVCIKFRPSIGLKALFDSKESCCSAVVFLEICGAQPKEKRNTSFP